MESFVAKIFVGHTTQRGGRTKWNGVILNPMAPDILQDGGGVDSSVLRNPSDPDATYQEKPGRNIRGMWQM